MPSDRKVLMFDMRSREEAEGETRMMGLGRREDEDEGEEEEEGLESSGFLGMLPAPGVGIMFGLPPVLALPCGRDRLRPRNSSAVLRMCEKSCVRWLVQGARAGVSYQTYRGPDPSENSVSVSQLALASIYSL